MPSKPTRKPINCSHCQQQGMSRRAMLQQSALGFGNLALASLVADQSLVAEETINRRLNPLAPLTPHFTPRAKRVIFLFMKGGPSHVDTFEYKPKLQRDDGKELPFKKPRVTFADTGKLLGSPWKFKAAGEMGMPVSELFPNVAECVDDICFLHSVHGTNSAHGGALLKLHTGSDNFVRPSMGSWVTYGLGSENQNLPGFVVLCPHGLPTQGVENWRSAFLPGAFQGSHVDTQFQNIEQLIENIRNSAIPESRQRTQLDLLLRLNRAHLKQRGYSPDLEARIQSFELAYRMQAEAAEAFDVSQETQGIQKMYGDSVQSRTLLTARRLVERGVRFVQVWYSGGQPWDNHDNIHIHRTLADNIDQGIGALLRDLKQRGLLDETLILCSGEFGRTPSVELPRPLLNSGKQQGRDHNHYGFSAWLAGGGIRGGHIHGATDETGWKAVEDRVHVHDIHATMLHLLGFDHERLTYRYAGRDFRLTDVHGQVVQDIIA